MKDFVEGCADNDSLVRIWPPQLVSVQWPPPVKLVLVDVLRLKAAWQERCAASPSRRPDSESVRLAQGGVARLARVAASNRGRHGVEVSVNRLLACLMLTISM